MIDAVLSPCPLNLKKRHTERSGFWSWSILIWWSGIYVLAALIDLCKAVVFFSIFLKYQKQEPWQWDNVLRVWLKTLTFVQIDIWWFLPFSLLNFLLIIDQFSWSIRFLGRCSAQKGISAMTKFSSLGSTGKPHIHVWTDKIYFFRNGHFFYLNKNISA